MTEERYPVHIGSCACSRTREYCVTRGCKKDDFEWRYSTEGRKEDRLRRIVDLRMLKRVEIPASIAGNFPTQVVSSPRPVSRWLRPERAVAEAWLMNMKQQPGVIEILKLGTFDIETPGVS